MGAASVSAASVSERISLMDDEQFFPIEDDDPLSCLVCGTAVLPVHGNPEVDGAVVNGSIAPVEGVHRDLEVAVCAVCLIDAGRKGRVVVRELRMPEEDVYLWPDGA